MLSHLTSVWKSQTCVVFHWPYSPQVISVQYITWFLWYVCVGTGCTAFSAGSDLLMGMLVYDSHTELGYPGKIVSWMLSISLTSPDPLGSYCAMHSSYIPSSRYMLYVGVMGPCLKLNARQQSRNHFWAQCVTLVGTWNLWKKKFSQSFSIVILWGTLGKFLYMHVLLIRWLRFESDNPLF